MSTTPVRGIDEQSLRQNLLESQARSAYDIYANRAGVYTAWEFLEERERAAWKELVETLHRDPNCATCGEEMYCLDCDHFEAYQCAACGEELICPVCDPVDDSASGDEGAP